MSTNSRSFIERQERMVMALSAKMASDIGHRADMYVEDSHRIDDDSCWLAVGYSQHLGPVTADNLEDFVIREFNGQLIPVMSTAKSFGEDGRVLVAMTRTNVTRPVEDSGHMAPVVAGAMYMDRQLGDTWEVQTSAEGQKYLSRVCSDDINSIVSERRRRMGGSGAEAFSITAALNNYGGTMNVGVGDTVKVLHKDGVHADCTVTSVSEHEVTVKIPKVGSVSMPREAVVQVQEISPKRLKAMESKLEDYFEQVYGPDYAKMLTRQTTRG